MRIQSRRSNFRQSSDSPLIARSTNAIRGVRLAICVFCASFLAFTAGCTSARDYIRNGYKVGPNYGRPAAPIAHDWIDSSDQRVRKESDDLSKWWTVFNDPMLDSL